MTPALREYLDEVVNTDVRRIEQWAFVMAASVMDAGRGRNLNLGAKLLLVEAYAFCTAMCLIDPAIEAEILAEIEKIVQDARDAQACGEPD